MSDHAERRDRIKELAEEFRLKAHLAGMEAKTLWEEELEPKLHNLEHKFDEATKELDIDAELASIERKLRKMVDDLIEG